LLEFTVPIAIVIILLDITLVYHASRTGRLQPWAFIILMLPFVGALAYIVVELVPEWFSGPGARQARKRVAARLDPEKVYRELSDRLANTDTIANRVALAAECLKVARFDEAERHYDHVLKLPMGGEPAYALGKAQAEFGRNHPADALATLDDLQKRWPDFQSAEGHLLYARTERSWACRRGAGRIPRGCCLLSRGRSASPVRYAAAYGGAHDRGQGDIQRTAASDEARAKTPARGPGRMAFDR
jgi:hypothetical protein